MGRRNIHSRGKAFKVYERGMEVVSVGNDVNDTLHTVSLVSS